VCALRAQARGSGGLLHLVLLRGRRAMHACMHASLPHTVQAWTALAVMAMMHWARLARTCSVAAVTKWRPNSRPMSSAPFPSTSTHAPTMLHRRTQQCAQCMPLSVSSAAVRHFLVFERLAVAGLAGACGRHAACWGTDHTSCTRHASTPPVDDTVSIWAHVWLPHPCFRRNPRLLKHLLPVCPPGMECVVRRLAAARVAACMTVFSMLLARMLTCHMCMGTAMMHCMRLKHNTKKHASSTAVWECMPPMNMHAGLWPMMPLLTRCSSHSTSQHNQRT
jgi:hypothetical protein